MDLDFFAAEENSNNLKANINTFLNATESNSLSEFRLSEDEFEQLIDYFINSEDLENTELCAELAFSQHPYSSRLLVQLCDTLILSGSIKKALSILDNYIDSFSSCATLYIVYARAYIKSMEFKKAKEWYKKSMMHIEDDIERYELTYSLALDCIEVKEFNRAIFYLNEIDSMNCSAHEYYNDYAFCFDKINNTTKAIEYYNKFLDADPFNDIVWFNIGTMHAKISNYDAAIEAYEYSIALNSKNDSSLFNLALVYINLSRFKEAIEPLKSCIECDSSSIDSYFTLAEAYIGLKELQLAKETYTKILGIDNNNKEASVSYMCIKAIQQYLDGEFDEFVYTISDLTSDNFEAISKIYRFYPSLSNDSNFLDLLLKIKN